LPFVQFALVVSIAGYLTAVWIALDRRNHQTWEQLAVRIHTAPGRWAAFHNAGISLEMVDFACQADRPIDAKLARTLRAEAMRVRLAAVMAPNRWSSPLR
jgi:hypothetical protein